MNKILMPAGVAVLVVIAIFLGVGLWSANARATVGWRLPAGEATLLESARPQPGVLAAKGIVVAGEGTIKAEPDVAYVTAGVQNTASTAQAAQQENARLMNAVLSKLESMGYAKKDLRTTGVSVRPIYERSGQGPTGFQASNQLMVTVNDIGRAGSVYDATVSAGANVAGNIRFGFKSDAGLRVQALREAVKSARAKADALADEMGVKISGVEAIVEEGISVPPVPILERAATMAAEAPTPVIPGDLTISARVRVTYTY